MKRSSTGILERRRRTGGRSARIVAGVLDATIDVLARVGYDGLTFEAVARSANVSRATVYRRWTSKRELVRAALLCLCEARLPPLPDTGSLRGDLRRVVGVLTVEAPRDRQRTAALVSAVSAEFDDPELSAVLRVVRARAQQPLFRIIDRATARGELPRGLDPALVIDPLVATLHFRRATRGDEPADFAERLLDLVIAGARTLGAAR